MQNILKSFHDASDHFNDLCLLIGSKFSHNFFSFTIVKILYSGILTVDHFRWVVDSRRAHVVHIFGVPYSCQPLSCDRFHCLPIDPFLNASPWIYVHRCCDEPMRIAYTRICQYCMMPIPHLMFIIIFVDPSTCGHGHSSSSSKDET